MLLKITVLGICVSVICMLLSRYYKEAVLPLEIAFIVISVILVTDEIKGVVKELSSYMGDIGEGTKILGSLMKGAVICILTKISCDLCKDSGNNVVADMIDIVGRIVLVSLCFPFVQSIIKTAFSFAS